MAAAAAAVTTPLLLAALVQLIALPQSWTPAARAADAGLATALEAVDRCAARAADPWPCLGRGVRLLVAAAAEYPDDIPLVGRYLSVVPDARRAGARRVAKADASVYTRLAEFADGRELRASLPLDAVVRILSGAAAPPAAAEPRGKKDKGAGGVLMLGGMMMITTLMSTAFGALALMAAKGLLTSILALMLSAMAVAKKSGHGHARTTYEVINALPAHHRYQDAVTGYNKLENGVAAAAAVSDINPQYNTVQPESIQYGNQQYD